MNGIRVATPGGPESMEFTTLEPLKPGAGEVLVRLEAIGVNFIDVYHRSGLYPMSPPFTPGTEAAGVVEAVGSGVEDPRVGDRVAYVHPGAYAEMALVPAEKLVPVPDTIDSRTAAAALLQGLTAHYLTVSTRPLTGGESVLVHAAAGGVGALLVQMARRRGAYVFGTASSSKLEIVAEAGADRVIDYTSERFDEVVLDETDRVGVDVVYDSVGQSTFEGSLNATRIRGMLVMFGQSSGPVPPVDVLRLSRKSLFLTRPTVTHYAATREELRWRAAELFEEIASGRLRLRIHGELPLRDAPEAHRLLEGRRTAGKLLLIP